MTKIAVLGAGVMATALTVPLADNGHDVHLVGTHLDEAIIDSIAANHVHPVLEVEIPSNVIPHQLADAEAAFADAEVVMVGVNSFGIDWAGEQLARLLKPGQRVIVITKGMRADEDGTLHILPEVLQAAVGDLAGQVPWAAIVGPSIAGELAVRRDTCVNFASTDLENAEFLAKLFRTSYYHVWPATDFVGCEVGAATKNVYAFGMGFANGILEKMGPEASKKYVMYNYSAALFGQGSIELKDFIEMMGGDRATGDGLGGVGDMWVTSAGGRNVRAGGFVGQGVPFSEVRDVHMKGITLEGVAAIRVIGEALEKLTARGVVSAEKFPLCRFLYDIVAKDAPLEVPWDTFYGGIKN
ncbi:NAD(P)H-dependent glycerol-3-phosphate dehydrogenase [Luteococcus sanguinis]|uniref:Glycerol-3-phosphate dehydrogenase n=1 Tax=Luteococcus sanguinis TaxID=174038 RepID=A0ABW1X213_9ACTN